MESANTEHGVQTESDKSQKELIKLGMHRTSHEFVQEALSIGPSIEVNALFPKCIGGVVDNILASHINYLRESAQLSCVGGQFLLRSLQEQN